MTQLTTKALEIAISQLGVKESPIGSNSGPEVDKYLASVGLPKGNSWCMAFVYWCFDKASHDLKITNPLTKTGGVLNQYTLEKSNHITDKPQPGDIFIMDLGKGLGHTGIIESLGSDGLHTIEANTNDIGSREGYMVARKLRHDKKPIIGYLRY